MTARSMSGLKFPTRRRAARAGISASSLLPRRWTRSECASFFWRVRKVEGLAARHLALSLQDQDRAASLGSAGAGSGNPGRRRPGLEKFEMLYQHDAGVIRMRRYLAQEARKQLVELQVAGK